MKDCLVDHELDLERRGEGGDLQHDGQHDHVQEGGREARHLRPQARQPHRRARVDDAEIRGRRQLEHDAGEVLRHFRERHGAHADGRIVDHDRAGGDRTQHDVVIEVPVQDRRRLDLGQSSELDPQRAG